MHAFLHCHTLRACSLSIPQLRACILIDYFLNITELQTPRCYDTAARCYDTAASRVILGIGRLVITADQAHTPGLCLQQDSTTNCEMGLCYVAVMCGAARCVGNRLKRCQFCNPICMRLLWTITVRVGARGRTDVVQRQLSGHQWQPDGVTMHCARVQATTPISPTSPRDSSRTVGCRFDIGAPRAA